MRVRGDQIDAAQATMGELAQEGDQGGIDLGGTDLDAGRLALAVGGDGDRDDRHHRNNARLLAGLHVGCVVTCSPEMPSL